MGKKWSRRILRWAGIAVAAFAVTWPTSNFYYEREFEAEVESLRKAGVRVELAAFNRPAIPERENAAVVLREGMRWCEECELDLDAVTLRWEVSDRWVRDRIAAGEAPGEDLVRERDQAWEEVSRVLASLRPWYVRIERAVALSECSFDVDHARFLKPDIEPHRTTRTVVESLDWRVRARVRRDGSVPQSIRDCETLLKWGQHIDPVLSLRYSVYGVLHATACGMVRRVSAQPGFVPGFAHQRLESLLIAAEHDEARIRTTVDSVFAASIAAVRLWTTWEGSRDMAKAMAALAAIASKSPEQILNPKPDNGLMLRAAIRRPLIWRDGTRAIAGWNEGAAILFRDDAATLPDLKVLSARDDATTPGYRTLHWLHKRRLQLRAHVRVTRVGLAVLEHRRREGQWPGSAAAVSPLFTHGIPDDPFTREPFALVRDGESIRIEAAVPWLDEYEGAEREDQRIYWILAPRTPPK